MPHTSTDPCPACATIWVYGHSRNAECQCTSTAWQKRNSVYVRRPNSRTDYCVCGACTFVSVTFRLLSLWGTRGPPTASSQISTSMTSSDLQSQCGSGGTNVDGYSVARLTRFSGAPIPRPIARGPPPKPNRKRGATTAPAPGSPPIPLNLPRVVRVYVSEHSLQPFDGFLSTATSTCWCSTASFARLANCSACN